MCKCVIGIGSRYKSIKQNICIIIYLQMIHIGSRHSEIVIWYFQFTLSTLHEHEDNKPTVIICM